MLSKNYLILAHKNFQQLNRLINRLDDGFSHFIIHLDASADLLLLKNTLGEKQNLYFLEKRED